MPFKRWPRRSAAPGRAIHTARKTIVMLLFLLIAAAAVACGFLFRSLVTGLAVSSARDVVVTSVNSIVKDIMTDSDFDTAGLVNLEKDADGNITAVTTNVAAVNTLASEVLERTVELTAEQVISISVPLGNFAGTPLLLNKGPSITVNIVMLSSSVAGFRSELTSAGINQTRHQIMLELNVQASLLMPWRTISTSVDTEVLVSETVIVGDVPDSYLNWENN